MNQRNQTASDLGGSLYIKPPKAAELLGISQSWLAKMRVRGGGPAYVKIGRSVRYPRDELTAWLENRLRTSTSDDQTDSHRITS